MRKNTLGLPRFKKAANVGICLVLLATLLGASGARARAATCDGRDADQVDLYTPAFSNPTMIDNPLFPVSGQGQVIHLGTLEGDPLRFETTLLPWTKTVAFNGRQVETAVIEYVAYQDMRIVETAYDYFAQDDAGAVWYFGEDVDNYSDGVIEDHEGTWLAGKDGPAGMIMPAAPKLGDVYRPENIAGSVFEEVTVKRTGVTFQGPTGSVPGGIVVEECLMDGTTEEKFFAPGYGEFQIHTEDESAKVALLVPKDSKPGAVPGPLDTIEDAADELIRNAGRLSPEERRQKLDGVSSAWARYRKTALPPLLKIQMADAIRELSSAVADGAGDGIRRAAVGVAHAAVDLTLQYEDPASVDRDRLDIWRQQLALDRLTGEPGDVAGDRAVIRVVGARIP